MAAVSLSLSFLVGPLASSRIAKSSVRPQALILPAGDDQLVPKPHAAELEDVCKDGGMDVRRVAVFGALHHEVLSKHESRQALGSFLRSITKKGQCQLSLDGASAMLKAVGYACPTQQHS